MERSRDGKRRIAEAVWRTVARDGVAGVSVRAVAAEAGVTGGTVQYHFPTHAQMLHFAMELLAEQFTQRLVNMPRSGPVLEWTRAILLELLPLSDERHREFQVWLAFTTHAHTDPGLTALKQRFATQLRELYQRLIHARHASSGRTNVPSSPAPDTADDQDAAVLQAVIDGLALQLADMTPSEAGAMGPSLLDHFLEIAAASADLHPHHSDRG
ncbi:TetR/AcrR family transcriptional regulator [Ruania zhangjianzhongii]|uniref:TetR/AcrR family transcriptional regulator n=1 Tax=Ruania zhangjianzhongii TaxID=2603206 RepID=UPI0011C955EC|nr:TetR family transcriptional regulator C-terminal domain-containing protein [Ruania zhangjianzhongii]